MDNRQGMGVIANNIKKGDCVIFDGEPYEVLDKEHVAMQQRRAVVKMKIRQLKSGKVVDKSVLALNEVETPEDLEKGTAVFVYSKGQEYWFHEAGKPQNRFVLKEEFIRTQGKFLKSQMEITTLSFDGKIIKINLPVKYEYKIVETPPAVKGATAAGGGKPAKIETGAMVSVPMFVEAGDMIIVNTEKGEYVSKAQ